MELGEKLEYIPDKPGVYIMKDKLGRVLYVGKALSLKKRLRSYFQESRDLSPRLQSMVAQVSNFDYLVTDSEKEALILECNLIKKHRPRYNVRLRDDKSYPFVRVTLAERYPRAFVTRKMVEDGSRYFGPYTSVESLRNTLSLIEQLFPLRSCKKVLGEKLERPCLNYHIKRCLAPCARKISEGEYKTLVDEVCLFLEGKQDRLLKDLYQRMAEAANALLFEKAAKLRDQIRAIEKVQETQRVVSLEKKDQDVVALVCERRDGCVNIFMVREGKLVGREVFFLEGIQAISPGEVLTAFVKQYYSCATYIPQEVVLSQEIQELDLIKSWLSERKGREVEIFLPQEGEGLKLMEMGLSNAKLALEERRLKLQREMSEKEALKDLRRFLRLPTILRHIEAIDISSIYGQEAVGSTIVFIDGKPEKKEYRHFKIKTVEGIDDYAMMEEVVRRRYKRVLEEKGPLPNLILIDGGKGHLNSALKVLKELNLEKTPAIGLAKEQEHIFLPEVEEPLLLPPHSPALYLIQRIRDEAHRFALSYHRRLREKALSTSLLDEIEGIGEKRKQALLVKFGSIEKLKEASLEDLTKVEGMNRKIAELLYRRLHTQD